MPPMTQDAIARWLRDHGVDEGVIAEEAPYLAEHYAGQDLGSVLEGALGGYLQRSRSGGDRDAGGYDTRENDPAVGELEEPGYAPARTDSAALKPPMTQDAIARWLRDHGVDEGVIAEEAPYIAAQYGDPDEDPLAVLQGSIGSYLQRSRSGGDRDAGGYDTRENDPAVMTAWGTTDARTDSAPPPQTVAAQPPTTAARTEAPLALGGGDTDPSAGLGRLGAGAPTEAPRPGANFTAGGGTQFDGRSTFPEIPALREAPRPNFPAPPTPPPLTFDPYEAGAPLTFDPYAAGAPFAYDDWRAPSIDQVVADPSYQWRKSQGEDSLQRWAAAKGTLNDSGTATALMDYGQNAASQEYGNVYGREFDIYRTNRAGALDAHNVNEGNRFNTYLANQAGKAATYDANYQTQYADPFRFEYQRQMDLLVPEMAEWQNEADLKKMQYGADAGFRNLQFDAGADFRNLQFGAEADFRNLQFGTEADLKKFQLGTDADFRNLQFGAEADFRNLQFSTGAEDTRQTQQLSMTDAWNRFLADLEEKRWRDDFAWRVASED